MQSTLTANHLADMSRSQERMSRLIFWTLIAALIACAGSALYHVLTVDQPWLRLGQVWAIGAILYLAAPTLNRGPVRRDANEPSGRFLVREHEERRRGYLWLRSRLFLLLPSMGASWWGMVQARSRGLDSPVGFAELLAGSWPFLLTGASLIIVWFALGKIAERVNREADEVRQRIEVSSPDPS